MIIFLINYFGEDHSFRNVKLVYSEIMLFKIVVILSNMIKFGLNVTIYYGFCKLLTVLFYSVQFYSILFSSIHPTASSLQRPLGVKILYCN